jgi:hypothetical protein
MAESDLFEKMLATYPAEKRELARQVYHRFAEGDSTQFFTQLLLVLDVYAHYAERVPKATIEAGQELSAILQDTREEIGMIANTIEARDVNITNHAAKLDELCKITQAKCNETIASIELTVKNAGSQVDTKAIAQKLEDTIKSTFLPLQVRADKLAETVEPTLEKLNVASERAAQLWPGRIWRMALTSGVIVGLSIAALGIGFSYWKIKRHYDTALAEQITSEAATLTHNQKAFIALGILNAPIHVARSTDSQGHFLPNTYCIYVEGAQEADMSDKTGRIFFGSSRSEKELQQLLNDTQARQGYSIMQQ